MVIQKFIKIETPWQMQKLTSIISTDLKNFWWDLKINDTVNLNTWIKINLVSFLVSCKI